VRLRFVLGPLLLAACIEPESERLPGLEVDPPELDFGRLTAPQLRTLQVRNAGEKVLHVEPPRLDSSDFSVSPLDGFELPPGRAAVLEVTALRKRPGLKSAELVLSARGLEPVRVRLTSEPYAVPACVFQVTPTRVELGVIARVAEVEIKVVNTGPGECWLDDIAFAGGVSPIFTLADPLPLVVAAGMTGVLKVRADPSAFTTVSHETATLDVGGTEVTLSAITRPACLGVSPQFLSFGEVSLGCSLTRAFTIANGCPAAVELAGVRTQGPFSLLESWPPRVLAPGEGAQPNVQFNPGLSGWNGGAAVVTLRQNGVELPASVSLDGIGHPDGGACP